MVNQVKKSKINFNEGIIRKVLTFYDNVKERGEQSKFQNTKHKEMKRKK